MQSRQIILLLVLVASAIGVTVALVNPSAIWPRHVDQGVAAGPHANSPPPDADLAEVQLARVQRAPVTDGFVPGDGLDALPDPLLAAPGGASGSPGEPPKVATLTELQEFREYVASSLSEIRTQEASDRFRTLQEQATRMDETMAPLVSLLKLTPHQSDKLRTVLLARLDRATEYVRLWEKGADQEILNELKASDSKADRKQLSGFLTADQLKTYLSLAGSRGN